MHSKRTNCKNQSSNTKSRRCVFSKRPPATLQNASMLRRLCPCSDLAVVIIHVAAVLDLLLWHHGDGLFGYLLQGFGDRVGRTVGDDLGVRLRHRLERLDDGVLLLACRWKCGLAADARGKDGLLQGDSPHSTLTLRPSIGRPAQTWFMSFMSVATQSAKILRSSRRPCAHRHR